MTCSVLDCARTVFSRGWCQMHYTRWLRHGDPAITHGGRNETERFWLKVLPAPADACWLWTGASPAGYGLFTVHRGGRRVGVPAHRFAYEAMVDEIPDGLQLDHLCRVTLCVNPWHLDPVTPAVNTARSTSPTALNMAKTHCPQGHEYDDPNTRKYRGWRYCKACAKDQRAAARAAARAVLADALVGGAA